MARRKRLTRRRRSRQFRGRQRFKTMRRRVKRGRIRRYTKVGKFRGGTSKQISRRCRKYCRRKGKRGGMESTDGGKNCYRVCLEGLQGEGAPIKGGTFQEAIDGGKIKKVTDLNQQKALDPLIAAVGVAAPTDKDEKIGELRKLNGTNDAINTLEAKNGGKGFDPISEFNGMDLTTLTTLQAWNTAEGKMKAVKAVIDTITVGEGDEEMLGKITDTGVYNSSNFKKYVDLIKEFNQINLPPKPAK
uniref:Uncharacterized protein n=1 Tax=Megaviridae environmental sample TaxID=1737588 RepID=A0A5J6VM40_9VIRU|nr:MAG: hypothetical protein [Megaviridae environmental sample]